MSNPNKFLLSHSHLLSACFYRRKLWRNIMARAKLGRSKPYIFCGNSSHKIYDAHTSHSSDTSPFTGDTGLVCLTLDIHSCMLNKSPSHLIQIISPTSFLFLCQSSFCGVLLTMYQQCYGTFLLQWQCPTHEACWLLAFWHDALLPACPVLHNHVRTAQTKLMLAGGNPHLLAETATMPLPNPSLFVG